MSDNIAPIYDGNLKINTFFDRLESAVKHAVNTDGLTVAEVVGTLDLLHLKYSMLALGIQTPE